MRGLLAGLLLCAVALPASAGTYDLVIDRSVKKIDGEERRVFTINGEIGGPVLRWTEGEDVTINVTNRLAEDTSIHWHGILLPSNMDGVPGISFDGIKPGTTFTYRFKVRQSGTYWYHSHSGGQEQDGLYAPIVIAPKGGEKIKADRDHVVLLSDQHALPASAILRKLKQEPGYFNDQRRTLSGLVRALAEAKTPEERQAIVSDRAMWAKMRMDPTDLADVSGYTFLVNGLGPADNWTGLFAPGEKVRLRFVNGSAMTLFDVSIPGLRMTVVQADGNAVQPVTVDEFRLAPGETYDMIVEPREARAYTIAARSIDRRGFARATLAPRPGMAGPMPEPRAPGVLGMMDMGMDMAGMDMSAMDHSRMDHAPFPQVPPVEAPPGSRVLSYADLKRLDRSYPLPEPARTIELRLTGNMDRYIWSFDDKKYSESPSVDFTEGETVRLVLRNETMMNHPIHLHGLWMDLDNGSGAERPRKHTVIVPPGRTVSVDVTLSEAGRWPFHCHLLFHMMTGMFREFVVHPRGTPPPVAATTPALPMSMPMGGHAHRH
ncbi:MAG: copper resistance system multicopper oxidase [Proteobacteria bacterium]|nr:copper resistance system multicopper oxidase [Pseudomonadota bacterium]